MYLNCPSNDDPAITSHCTEIYSYIIGPIMLTFYFNTFVNICNASIRFVRPIIKVLFTRHGRRRKSQIRFQRKNSGVISLAYMRCVRFNLFFFSSLHFGNYAFVWLRTLRVVCVIFVGTHQTQTLNIIMKNQDFEREFFLSCTI